jgi:hypothetical protein
MPEGHRFFLLYQPSALSQSQRKKIRHLDACGRWVAIERGGGDNQRMAQRQVPEDFSGCAVAGIVEMLIAHGQL